MVGVVPLSNATKGTWGYTVGKFFFGWKRGVWGPDQNVLTPVGFGSGDEVTVRLDFGKHSVSFEVNNEHVVTQTLVPLSIAHEPHYFAISSLHAGESVTIVRVE